MSNFLSDLKDRFQSIPPWGYAAIAIGVLGLALYSKRSGQTTTEQITTSVDPYTSTAISDLQSALDVRLGQLEQKISESESTDGKSVDTVTITDRGVWYVVQDGESLESIGNKMYRSGYTGTNKAKLDKANASRSITKGTRIWVPW